jgi:RecG-like helicase
MFLLDKYSSHRNITNAFHNINQIIKTERKKCCCTIDQEETIYNLHAIIAQQILDDNTPRINVDESVLKKFLLKLSQNHSVVDQGQICDCNCKKILNIIIPLFFSMTLLRVANNIDPFDDETRDKILNYVLNYVDLSFKYSNSGTNEEQILDYLDKIALFYIDPQEALLLEDIERNSQ